MTLEQRDAIYRHATLLATLANSGADVGVVLSAFGNLCGEVARLLDDEAEADKT